MSISFNQIAANIRTPGFYAEFDNSKANKGLVADATRVLLFAQKLATGTAAALTPIRTINADQAVGDAGRGSMGAAMVAAFKGVNAETDLTVVYLDDAAAGTAAAASITLGGAATKASTRAIYVGGERIRFAVRSGDTPDIAAETLVAAIAELPDLVFTAAVDGATPAKVNLTARHKGEAFNGLDIRVGYYDDEKVVDGLTFTVAPFAGGAGNPDIEAALAALSDVQYHQVVMPYTDSANLAAVVADFTDRWSGMRQIEGQVWAASTKNHAGLTTLGNGQNSEVLSIMGGYGSPTPAYVIAALFGAVAAFNLDLDPARPLQTLWLKGMMAPAEADRFTRTERNLLLWDGISTFTVTQDGRCLIERAVTTYQTNLYGLADPSYLDVETPATLAMLRRTWRTRMSQKFPRHKLADDGTNFGPGQAIVTPSILRAEMISLARDWEERGWVENLDAFKDQLLVVRNGDDRTRVDAVLPPDLVNQLRVLAAKVEFRR